MLYLSKLAHMSSSDLADALGADTRSLRGEVGNASFCGENMEDSI